MSDKAKKVTRWIMWTMFGAWNILLFFVISGKQSPKLTEKSPVEHVQVLKSNQPVHEFENAHAHYKFSGTSLRCVGLKKYKQNTTTDADYVIIEKNDVIAIKWSGNTYLPDENTVWDQVQDGNTITFKWRNSQNVEFIQKWTFDDNYGIDVNVGIVNASSNSICVTPSIEMRKTGFEKGQSFIFSGVTIFSQNKMRNYGANGIKHTILPANPPAAYISNVSASAIDKSQESGFDVVSDPVAKVPSSMAAFNEKYWLVAVCSKDLALISVDKKELYEISSKSQELNINPKQTGKLEFSLYVGPKELDNLKRFGANHDIPNVENTIDYGWLFFLTKPVNYVLKFFVAKLASVVLALLLLTFLCKLITWPFTISSHLAMQRINALAPAINEIKFKLKDSPELMNKEIFALYKKYKINPISGCLPSILQMLLLFPLYKVLSFSIDLRLASFPGWIRDLSSSDPTSAINLFGLLPFGAPSFLHIGAWPILMGVSMLIQQNLSSVQQIQTREQKIMQYGLPLLFTWMMSGLPAGVVIYWTLMNFLTILQILWVNYSRNRKISDAR